MISAGEVGAVFKVVDEASPILKRLMDQFNALQVTIDRVKLSMKDFMFPPGLSRSLTNMEKALKGVATQTETTSGAVSSGFAKMDESVALTQANIARLGKEIRGLAAESKALGFGAGVSVGGAPTSIRSRSRDPHISSRVPVGDTPFHATGGSLPAMAAGVGLAYGFYQNMKLEDAVPQLIYHTGMAPSDANEKMFRGVLEQGMSDTGFSLDEVTKASLQEIRMFKGTPGGGLGVLPQLLRSAAVEARLKGTSLDESMTAFIGYAHMMKAYSPEAIAKLAPAFAFASSINPTSLTSMERASSYAVPILQSGLEIDPLQTLMLGTVLTRAGATNTKSGTWLRNMVLNSMPGSSLMSSTAFKHHEDALHALGLADNKGEPTWFTDGKPDPYKLLDIASAHAASIPLDMRAAYEKQLFGAQGFGGFALLADPAVRSQIDSLNTERNSEEFKNRYANFWQYYNNRSPIQEGRSSWADLNVELMDISNGVLPAVTSGLKAFDGVLRAMKSTLGDKTSNAVIDTGIFAGVAAWLFPNATRSLLTGAINVLTKIGPWGWLGAGTLAGGAYLYENPPHGLDPNTQTPWGRASAIRRGDLPYMNGGPMAANLAGIGNEIHVPAPQVTNKVNVSVFVDGKNIPSTTRVVNDSSHFDPQADPPYPDIHSWR
jgi:hypothetical protein